VRPHAGQSRVGIFQLGQLDLELCLEGLCSGGENIEDKLAAVQDLDGDNVFEFANLTRGEVVIEYDYVGLESADAPGKESGFSFADVGYGVDGADFLLEFVDPRTAPTSMARSFLTLSVCRNFSK
jgi:hypothetical protein